MPDQSTSLVTAAMTVAYEWFPFGGKCACSVFWDIRFAVAEVPLVIGNGSIQ